MFSKDLEATIGQCYKHARESRDEYMTVEHLLLALLDNPSAREVLKAVGERRRIELYELLAPKHGLSPERERSRDHFWRGVIYFREKQWDKAIEEFTKSRITGIPDTALDLYIQRVERSRRGEADASKDQMVLFSNT